MRIVDRKTFLAMPAGTVFAKFKPHMIGALAIKEDNFGDSDFWTVDLNTPFYEGAIDDNEHFEVIEQMMAGQESPPLDYDTVTRDGLYDKDQLFAVWSAEDVDKLIQHLQWARDKAMGTIRGEDPKAILGPWDELTIVPFDQVKEDQADANAWPPKRSKWQHLGPFDADFEPLKLDLPLAIGEPPALPKPPMQLDIRKSAWPVPHKGDEFTFRDIVWEVKNDPVDLGEAWRIQAVDVQWRYAHEPFVRGYGWSAMR